MIMTDRQSVAANAVVGNACAGKSGEFITEPCVVRLYGTASAVGMNMSLIVGEEIDIDDQEVNAQNRMPINPDDFIGEAGGLPGDRIVLKYRNTTAAPITAFSKIEIEPV